MAMIRQAISPSGCSPSQESLTASSCTVRFISALYRMADVHWYVWTVFLNGPSTAVFFTYLLQVNYEPFMKDLSKRKRIQQPLHCRRHVFNDKCIFLSVIFSHATLDIDAESADLWISITLLRSPWVFKKAQ